MEAAAWNFSPGSRFFWVKKIRLHHVVQPGKLPEFNV